MLSERAETSADIDALASLYRDRSTESRQSRYRRRYYGTPFPFFFFPRQVRRGPSQNKIRSSHIVLDAPQALRAWAMNNENSPNGETAGKAKKKKKPKGSGVLVRSHDVSTSSEGRFMHPWPWLSAVTRGFDYNHGPVYFHRGFNVGRDSTVREFTRCDKRDDTECRTLHNVT